MATAAVLPTRPVLADLLPGARVRDAVLVVGGAGLTGLAAQVSFHTPLSPVPFTLQTLSVLVVGASLGTVRGTLSIALYALAGIAGVPWYANHQHGWGGVNFGYILGFVAAAAIVGELARRGNDRTITGTVGLMTMGTAVIYAAGAVWLAQDLHVSASKAVALGVTPFLITDAVKMAIAAVVLPAAWKLVPPGSLTSTLLVTGGGDDAGCALAVAALAAVRIAVVIELAQTGLADGRAGELARVTRLVPAAEPLEFVRYPADLLPAHAAAASGRPQLAFADTVRRLVDLDAAHDLVLVRGRGGLLAPYDDDRRTLVDLAHALSAPVLAVAPADRDGLDRLLLTLAALEDQGVACAGVVLTGWPELPTDAQRWTVAELWRLSTRELLVGVLPADAGGWAPRDFRRRARALVSPAHGGTFDARSFVARHAPA